MKSQTFPQPLDHTFTAPIEKDGAFATYLTMLGSAKLLGTRRAVKGRGTIDGYPFAATLMPSGDGPHWLPMKAALCKLIGKDQAGMEVADHLEQRFSRPSTWAQGVYGHHVPAMFIGR